MSTDSSIKVEGATPEELKTWGYINRLKGEQEIYANKYWREGFRNLRNLLNSPTVFEDIAIPHWTIMPIDGKSEDHTFFDRLSKGVFNTNIYMRKWDQRDYLPTRCRWHDSYGHLPHLYSDHYSDVMRQMGVLGKLISKGDDSHFKTRALTWLSRLYWYTIEFGLIKEGDSIKALGAGIISSPGETRHVFFEAESLGKIKPFNLTDVINSDFEVYDFQHTYFLVNDLTQIELAIIKLYELIFFV